MTTSFYNIWRDNTTLVPEIEPDLKFPIWGCFVYRVTYKDQALWERYTEWITKSVHYTIGGRNYYAEYPDPESVKLGRVIKDHFHLCKKEGPEMDGKTIEQVQEIHLQWLESLPDEGRSHNEDGSHNCAEYQSAGTRYHNNCVRYYCAIYVDDEALARFASYLREADSREPNVSDSLDEATVVVFRVLEEAKIRHLQMPEDYPPPKNTGRPVKKPWIYVYARSLPCFFTELRGDWAWDDLYRRPPRIWSDC
ncbi:hypothetical protein HJFPF1_00295 [Paramyrothecium foliicola]|nr:hypothetical protein HJFPF1_00295 [Paramyrothecium foliicola]